jgi:hypothetical protein
VPAWAVGKHDGRERLQKIYAMIPELMPLAARKAL